MKLGIIGAGYVGLTTAICLASMKHEINIFDIDNEKIKSINGKKMPFFEPGLEELLDVNISKKILRGNNDLNTLVNNKWIQLKIMKRTIMRLLLEVRLFQIQLGRFYYQLLQKS